MKNIISKSKANYAEYYYNKGNKLRNSGENEKAIKAYNKTIKCKPDYVKAYFKKGLALSGLERYQPAIEAFDHTTKLKNDFAHAHLSKGNALNKLKKYEESIKVYDLVIKLQPDFVSAYFNKGTALDILERPQEAMEAYDQAIKYDSNNALFYCAKGQILNKLGKEPEALEYFNKAFEISKSGNLGDNLSESHILGINKTLSEDRKVLLQKLIKLQETTIETQKIVDILDQNDPAVKKVVKRLDGLRKSKTISTEETFKSIGEPLKENTTEQKTIELLSRQIIELQTQMDALHREVKELRGELGIVKEEQAKTVNKLVLDMQSKLGANKAIDKEDKTAMQRQLNDITKKMQNMANKADVEKITQEMKSLIMQNKITKITLLDLESNVNKIIEKQASSTKAYILTNNELINHENNCDVNELVLGGLISIENTEAPAG